LSQFIIDLLFSTIFALLLILLIKVKEKTFLDNKDSYQYTLGGMTALAIVSLVQLAGHQNLFFGVPFLSEPMYQELIEVIGIIAGVALMIAGVTLWLPAKKKRDNLEIERMKRYESFEKMQRFIETSEDMGRLFEILPELINHQFGIRSTAIFRLSHMSRRFVCTNHSNLAENRKESLENLARTAEKAESFFENARSLAEHSIQVSVNGRIEAILFVWGDHESQIGTEDKSFLNRLGKSLSARIMEQYGALKESFYEKSVDYFFQAKMIFSSRSDIKSKLPALYKIFHEATGAEYLSLSIPEKHRKNVLRYTVGIGGNLLQDGLTNPFFRNTYIDCVYESRRSMLVDNIEARKDFEADSLLISCGQKNLIVVPLVNYGRTIAVLTLGHSRIGRFTRRDLLMAEALSASLAPAVEGEVARHAGFERDKYLGALSTFQAALDKYEDIDSLLRAATDIIVENVSTTVARISVLNNERTELITKALRTIRPFENVKTENVALSREMTPWHNMVINENRLLLINQKDPESYMDYGEAESLVISRVNSALIIPIVIDDATYGIVTLGEMRDWERNSYDSAGISFCKGVAAVVANGIKMLQLSRTLAGPEKGAQVRLTTESPRTDIYREFQTPLTSLRGSIELLRHKGVGWTEGSEDIMTLMERSTEQMMSLLNRD